MSRTAVPARLAAVGVLIESALGLALGLALVGAVAAPALAHSTIVASTPEDGETLTALPEAFSVTANEELLDAAGTREGFVLQIVGPDGAHYESGQLTIDGATLSTPAILGPAGDYQLLYRVVSADGHPIEGSIPFAWAPDFATVEPVPLPTAEPLEPVETVEPTASAEPISAPATGDRRPVTGRTGAIITVAIILLGAAFGTVAPRRRKGR